MSDCVWPEREREEEEEEDLYKPNSVSFSLYLCGCDGQDEKQGLKTKHAGKGEMLRRTHKQVEFWILLHWTRHDKTDYYFFTKNSVSLLQTGTLAMANSGKNTNTSQFYITFGGANDSLTKLDGKHVVFGKVVEGLEALSIVESRASSESGKPVLPTIITDCGVL